MKRVIGLLCLAAFVVAATGCGKKEEPAAPPPPKVEAPAPSPAPSAAAAEVSVAKIDLGKAIGPDKKVTAAADSFAKNDTIYAVVETTGSGTATLAAKWTYHKGDQRMLRLHT